MDEKEEFEKRMEHLLNEVSACSKPLEAKRGKRMRTERNREGAGENKSNFNEEARAE